MLFRSRRRTRAAEAAAQPPPPATAATKPAADPTKPAPAPAPAPTGEPAAPAAAVPATTTTAGDAEATLLSTMALVTAARHIAARIGKGAEPIALVPGLARPDLAAARWFATATATLDARLDVAAELIAAARAAAPALPAPAAEAGLASIVAQLTEGLGKLGETFKTEYSFSALAVAARDDRLMLAVADALRDTGRKVRLPTLAAPADIAPIVAELRALAARVQAAVADAAEADAAVAARPAQAAPFARAAAAAHAAVAAFTALVAQLGATDDDGVTTLARAADERALATLLETHDLLLIRADAQLGGAYTSKNILNVIRYHVPMRVMGGAVASFALLAPDGTVRAAGVVPAHAGYRALSEIEVSVERFTAGRR